MIDLKNNNFVKIIGNFMEKDIKKEKSYYDSPVGILEITCLDNKLISLRLVDKKVQNIKESAFIKNIKAQLEEYFLAERKNFDIKISLKGTDFQKRVWEELIKIPYGKVKSYSEIANLIGNKNAQRAVGSACNKNPVMIIVPCHRVIAKNGNIGGFAYGNKAKQKLLELEKNSGN